jgi:ABC-type molybdate transport system ATPase subunit
MDEPTASLHPAASKNLEATVLRLNAERNVDVVWVTHDLAQIERLAQSLVVLASGRVIYTGALRTDEAVAALATLSEGQKS